MIRNVIIALILGAGLWACSDVYTISAEYEPIVITDDISSNASIDSMISPYQRQLSATMDEVIAYSPNDFTKGRPNASLNNWATDAVFYNSIFTSTDSLDLEKVPMMCLLNVGGLRNPINKGDVTVGDIFKLMPFDNEVVWVEMPWDTQDEIIDYLKKKGGEPIAGAVLDGDTLLFPTPAEKMDTYWVLTSDYLMNGGDKMDFFEKKVSYQYTNRLMRDVMLDAAKKQDTLVFDHEPRITL